METSKTYAIKTFELGDLVKAFREVFRIFECVIDDLEFWISTEINGINDDKEIKLDDLYSITQFDNHTKSITCRYKTFSDPHEEVRTFHSIRMTQAFIPNECFIILSISASKIETIDIIIKKIVEILSLEKFEPNYEDSEIRKIEKLEERINFLEERFKNLNQLTCFISMKFDDQSKVYFRILEKFLSLIDVKVTSGLSYEPRKVSEKVISKLENNVDFVICLITNQTESLWVRDEIVISNQMDQFLIPLVEKGSKFTAGIFGDLEYIEFELHCIESSFIQLLEGISFIKNNRRN